MVPGVSPALKRSLSWLIQAVPSEESGTLSSPVVVRDRPEGEESFSRTGTVTMSPARTTAVSLTPTGAWEAESGRGTMVILPVAVAVPLETVYSAVVWPWSSPTAEICMREWSTTVALTPEAGGVVAETATSTPPEGSLSLARGLTVMEPPGARKTVSSSTTGAAEGSEASAISTRMSPLAREVPSEAS